MHLGIAQLGGVAPVIAQLIKNELGYKYHWAADYLQRAARHIASQVDVDQAWALGKAAVQLALEGAIMPLCLSLNANKTHPINGPSAMWPLKMWRIKKKMPKEYITPDGMGITESCRRCLTPLIQGGPTHLIRMVYPVMFVLKINAFPKKLLRTIGRCLE